MENQQTLNNTRNSFLHEIFQKTQKNTKIRIHTLKNTTSIPIYHFTVEVPPQGGGGGVPSVVTMGVKTSGISLQHTWFNFKESAKIFTFMTS